MNNLKQYPLNNKYGEESGTKIVPSLDSWKQGIGFKSDVKSTTLTGDIYQLSEAVQYLQFTGGLYDKKAEYHEGNIVSLVYKNDRGVYEIQMFRRAGSNIGATTNNAPYNDAQVETVNGVDTYSGGTVNADWVMCSTSGSVEAVDGTLVQRDSEGASKINMPSVVDDKSIVNKEYLKAKNIFFDKSGSVSASDVQEAINSIYQTNVSQESQISTNKSDITNLEGRMSIAEGNITTNTNNISSNTGRITTLEAQVGNIKPPIPVMIAQYPVFSPSVGTYLFNTEHEPATYYKNNFGITTTWELINKSGVFYRCEGGRSYENRDEFGLQMDAGINATGEWSGTPNDKLSGVFRRVRSDSYFYQNGSIYGSWIVNIDLSRSYTPNNTGNEFRPSNALMRLWLLKTINGEPIQ